MCSELLPSKDWAGPGAKRKTLPRRPPRYALSPFVYMDNKTVEKSKVLIIFFPKTGSRRQLDTSTVQDTIQSVMSGRVRCIVSFWSPYPRFDVTQTHCRFPLIGSLHLIHDFRRRWLNDPKASRKRVKIGGAIGGNQKDGY
jgi:hypothetical protein